MWKQRVTEFLAETLFFIVRAALVTNLIFLAVASAYLVGRTCWFFVQYLDRVAFAEPW